MELSALQWRWLVFVLYFVVTTFDSNHAALRAVVAHDGIETLDVTNDEMNAAAAGFQDGMPDDFLADDATADVPEVIKLPPMDYTPPATTGLHFVETFDGDWKARWSRSTNEKFGGRWARVLRKMEALKGDYGIRLRDKAKHHAIASRFPGTSSKGKEFVVSYEVKFEDDITCGGAYLKLFDSQGMDIEDFDNETPYVIMFGPDKCGSTNKVHVIIKSKNPISGDWVEHHLTRPPGVPHNPDTHQFALRLLPDETFKVYVDGEVSREGTLHDEFEPPFTPPQVIDDPESFKPDDWVDDAEIPDPDETKPEDWDEDAPMKIPSPTETIPEGWLEDEQLEILDLEAVKPEHWDDIEDGDWHPPTISNPLCVVGCGPWSPPMVANPDYKGKWAPAKIPNPNYVGPWTPPQIANPHYFVDEHPHELSGTVIDAVGFELWTMDEGYLFDNIVVAHSWDAASSFLDASYRVRQPIEASHRVPEPKKNDLSSLDGGVSGIKAFLGPFLAELMTELPFQVIVFGGIAVAVLFFVSWFILSKRVKVPEGAQSAAKGAPEGTAKKSKKAGDGSDDESQAEVSAKSHDRDGTGEQKARKRGGRPVQAD